jgi:hypothetical protein
MISLKTRESFSAEAIEADTSIDKTDPGTRWPGSLLLTFFIMTFCCRYSQMSLLAAVQFNPPTVEWFAPDTSLLLLPAAIMAIPAGYFCSKETNSALTRTLVVLAIGLATMSILIGTQIFATTIIAGSIVFIAVGLEIGRIFAWSQIISDTTRYRVNSVNSLLVQLVLTEVAATALSVNGFRIVGESLPTIYAVRISSLLLTATFLLSSFAYVVGIGKSKSPRKAIKVAEIVNAGSELPLIPELPLLKKLGQGKILQRYPLSSMFLAIAANATAVTLLTMTLSSKVVANIPLFSFWSATAIGMLFGALYCLIPTNKLRISSLFVAVFLSCFSCALCIYKPTGPTLFIGLFLSGFAATLTTLTSFSQFLKYNLKYHLRASPGLYIGCQAACSYLLSFLIASVLEPRVEFLSSFVFVRLLAISQLIFLTAFGALSYIHYKYRRSQG